MARRVVRWLQKAGLSCWLDEHDIDLGEEWFEVIRKAIKSARVVVLILSKASNESSYVLAEITKAACYRKRVYCLRIEDVEPRESLQALIGKYQRFDAIGDQLEAKIAEFARAAEAHLRSNNPLQFLRQRLGDEYWDPFRLAKSVQEHWVNGFLKPALETDIPSTLPTRFTRCVSADHRLEAIDADKLFDDSGGRLFICGPAGSGKTIFMLQRVEELLRRLAEIEDGKVPVVLEASSWFDPSRPLDRQDSFDDWLVKRTSIQYGFPRSRVQRLLSRDKIIFCIDGLDQLGSGYEEEADLGSQITGEKVRSAFLEELKAFDEANASATQLIVTVSAVSDSVKRILKLSYVVQVEEIEANEVHRWLITNNRDVLSRFLSDHPVLFTRVRKNLFDLQIVAKSLGACGYESLDARFEGDEELFVAQCYHAYFLEIFNATPVLSREGKRQGKPIRCFDRQHFHRYLANIAGYLSRRGPGFIFRMDELTPLDLSGSLVRSYRRWLMLTVLIGIFLLSAISPAVGIWYGWHRLGHPDTALYRGLATAFAIGVLGGAIAATSYATIRDCGSFQLFGRRFEKSHLKRALALGFGFGIGRGATVGLSSADHGLRSGPIEGVIQGISGAFGGALVFFLLFHNLKDNPMDIKLMEKRQADIKRWWIAGGVGLVIGLLVTFVGKSTKPLDGTAFGISIFMLLGIFFGRKHESKPFRVRPNQGIRYALRLALGWSVITAAVCSSVFFFAYRYGYSERKGIEAAIEAWSFMLAFFFLDGLTVIKYIALRATLMRSDYIPRKLEALLRLAAHVGILRQVGGGFIYSSASVYRYLLTQRRNHSPNGEQEWLRP